MVLEIKFVSFDGGDDGEHNGVGLVDISKIFAMQDDFFLAKKNI